MDREKAPSRRGIIVRHDMPNVGYSLYELWELGDGDERVGRRRMSPVQWANGQPRRDEVDRAKQFLYLAAAQENLAIVREED